MTLLRWVCRHPPPGYFALTYGTASYYDVWMLTGAFKIDPERLRRAIAATFARRSTAIPVEVPDGLSEGFAADPRKQRRWNAFARTLSGTIPAFSVVVSELRQRLAGMLAVK